MFMAALSAALLTVPLRAQRGGGHGGMGGGGAHGGFVGHGGGGFVGAPRGAYWGGGFHGGYGYGFPGHYPYYGRYGYGRYPSWGYRAGYGWGWWGYPWGGWYGGIGWPDDSYSYPAQSYPVYAYSPPDNPNSYVSAEQQQEIDRLNDEVARLRDEQQSGATRSSAQQPKAQIQAGTVLVFRDHHSEEIQNYAIVGKTLWVFTEQRARKIPIAELNVPATTKANETRGIDFRLPGQ